jgi:hypothetical protein
MQVKFSICAQSIYQFYAQVSIDQFCRKQLTKLANLLMHSQCAPSEPISSSRKTRKLSSSTPNLKSIKTPSLLKKSLSISKYLYPFKRVSSSLAKGYDPLYSSSPLASLVGVYHNLESIFRAFKRKEMKASRRLAEDDIITRGVTVKIQQVTVRGNYETPTNDAKGEDE